MDRKEQKAFVRDLSRRVAESICDQIDRRVIPETWDGHELRSLLAYRHEESAKMTSIRKEPRSKRSRDFRNTIIVESL